MQGMGDRVTAKVVPGTPGTLSIEHITGDGGRLSLEPAKNCIGIAAQATLDMYKAAGHSVDIAISLSLVKVSRGACCSWPAALSALLHAAWLLPVIHFAAVSDIWMVLAIASRPLFQPPSG